MTNRHLTIDNTPGATPISVTTVPASTATQTTTATTPANSIDNSDQSPSGFIDQRELLRRVPISLRTLRTWRLNGVIPELKVNRRTLFHWPSVETALLNLQRRAK